MSIHLITRRIIGTNTTSRSSAAMHNRFTTTAFFTFLLGSGGGNSSIFNSNHNFQANAFSLNMSMSMSSSSPPSSSSSSNTKQQLHPLSNLSNNFNHSWITQLSPESNENRLKSKQKTPLDDGSSNNVKRPVYNGHYVPVRPVPLLNPRLVIYSKDMANELGMTSEEDVQSDAFVKFFSGDVDGAFLNHNDNGSTSGSTSSSHNNEDKNNVNVQTWATPYALSIMGKRYTSNCPFGTGDGYGDGRAISIGEVAVENTSHPMASPRYELQLKGAGPTPFCRGADGRAVLRSSIREFLASEAMHNLGIETTRALSLTMSEKGSTSQRPWYSERNKKNIPTVDDPRLQKYSLEQRKQIVAQLNAQSKNDPDIMIEEPNAITCRVAPSFVRVGHLDLFARRATKGLSDYSLGLGTSKPDKTSNEFKELEALVWHACFREFPKTCYDPFNESGDVLSASKCLLQHSMDGIATMVAGWIRVGFAQGNFNADNCLVAGRTMDYGPFGFMDEYHPLFAKWTGSGEHFGFMNQINAGYANFAMLVSSVMPIIEAYSGSMEEADAFKEEIMDNGQRMFEAKLMEALRSKMGFHPEDESVDELWTDLEELLRENHVDWTLFWRQLTVVAKEFPTSSSSFEYKEMFDVLNANDETKKGSSPFYESLDESARLNVQDWITAWMQALVESYKEDGPSTILCNEENNCIAPEERMRLANPKYVLREWMLVEAYTKASPSSIQSPMLPFLAQPTEADESMIHELFELIQNPYDEGSDEQDTKYYRRAPDEALLAGGTAFMS